MYSYKDNKLYIHRSTGKPLYIGHIDSKTNTLFIHDKDNYHSLSKSFGIDRDILESYKLEYHFIQFRVFEEKLITTRLYFLEHCKPYKLLNQRDQFFMEFRYFGVEKALIWEKNTLHEINSQLDIFEVGRQEAMTGNRLYNMFIKNLSKTIKQEGESYGKERKLVF
jgi:hypothetical protein